MRFGLLQHYRVIEGIRQDKSEGEASIRWNLEAESPDLHNVTYGGTSLNLYYVLCTSHPAVCRCHLAKFGPFTVRINEPLTLLKRICAAWKEDARSSSDAFITPVLYNKGDLVEPFLILRATATRTRIRVVTKRVRSKCDVQVLDSSSKFNSFFHALFYVQRG